MLYCLYILESVKDGSYCVGTTHNLDTRIKRHNEGRGCYTTPRRQREMVYSEEHPDRSSAMKREYEIKSHKRKTYIEDLVMKFKTG